jgi:hypothetical protein
MAQLHLKDGKREFDAYVRSTDISLSGVFFASTFLLKVGTAMDLEFQMPHDTRVVRVCGTVTREVRLDETTPAGTQTGFAIRFVSYGKNAKIVLAFSFLAADLDGFLTIYAHDHSVPRAETLRLREAIVSWEVGNMEFAMEEKDLLQSALRPRADAA